MRLRTDIWVSAYLRRVSAAGAFVAVRKKGVAEAGAIFIRIDHLDGRSALFGPAPQSVAGAGERTFTLLHAGDSIDNSEIETRLAKEQRFDPDLWIIEVEDRQKRTFLDDICP
jgi:hypothetical protein